MKLVHVGLLWGVDIAEEEEEEVEEKLMRDFSCVPVFVKKSIRNDMYWGYCKGVLWPVFHNVMDLMSGAQTKEYDECLWRSYCAVNRKFAECVVQVYDDANSLVWIHDYHLLVLPGTNLLTLTLTLIFFIFFIFL